MESYRSVIMEAFRDRFVAAELLSYKEVQFVEATEEWYAQRDPVEVDWVECDCICQAEQFFTSHGRVERTIIYLCTPSITNAQSGNTFRELPLAQTLYLTAG